jgi:predicted acylesterase/phospholipase RssA
VINYSKLQEKFAMTVALFLSGGAPNLSFMAGGVYEFDKLGVEYSLISTSGAGMLVGLLYAAPRGDGDVKTLRQEALRRTVEMYIDDRIFQLMEMYWGFPANYKIFHKSGPAAELYTRFWSQIPRPRFLDKSSQRFVDDLTELALSAMCPTDLTLWSKGICQPAPFIYDSVDFDKLKQVTAEFCMNAYCLDTHAMELFEKQDITPAHFHAALAFPLLYAPFKLNGKTYIEGSAIDTIGLKPVFDSLYQAEAKVDRETTWTGEELPPVYHPRPGRPEIDTLVVFNMLGHEKLLREPRHLLDAFSQEIVVPLVPSAKDQLSLFKQNDLPRYRHATPGLELLEVELNLTDAEWEASLDWSYTNGAALFERGCEAARDLYAAHKDRLAPQRQRTRKSADNQNNRIPTSVSRPISDYFSLTAA